MRKVLVINGNPKSVSFCGELVNSYIQACPANNEVKHVSLSELEFEPNLNGGYDSNLVLEPDLVSFQQSLLWAEHIVIVLPVWWGGMPAKLKGLVDRTLLPGFAFKYEKDKSIPKKLLKGRTADVVFTMDTPPFYYRWFQGNAVHKQLKHTVLGFCGIKQVSSTYIGPVLNSTQKQRDKWNSSVSKLAPID
ncbi:NAD(P)H-dependent oxidoreductase [Photobacterium makurazakiensis]|uniref:NAD(P)H-dependent oxidoreductase n=1 Tax=Photobacterium makurazakiensis TaxID=2910234 RepID=UPI003D0C63E7